MCELQKIIPSKLFETIERTGISTVKQILYLSIWDIKKITGLSIEDIIMLKNIVADYFLPSSFTASKMLNDVRRKDTKVTTGCSKFDSILLGGFRKGTITEIFGESGTGKTQLAIQASLHNWPSSIIYICTEDLFPIKRLNEIKKGIPNYDPSIDYGERIFVEHVIEAKDLLSCIRVRLPKLLTKHKFSLIIIDSVAAPFRVDNINYVQRAEELRELSVALISLSQEHNLAVLCINQVTTSIDDSGTLVPSLGLAWSNMVSTRLWLRKSMKTVNDSNLNDHVHNKEYSKVKIRELLVTFAPDLPNSVVEFVITNRGIQAISQLNL